MSVLKNKRSVSSLEFYHNAIMLRREITMLLLRDFGIKDKVRSVKSLYGVPGMEPEDEQKFREIVEKYEMKATIIEEYPAWLIDKMRNNRQIRYIQYVRVSSMTVETSKIMP